MMIWRLIAWCLIVVNGSDKHRSMSKLTGS